MHIENGKEASRNETSPNFLLCPFLSMECKGHQHLLILYFCTLMYLFAVYFLVFIFIKLISWIVQLEQAILLHVWMISELFWRKS
jgi:hypothetical protein